MNSLAEAFGKNVVPLALGLWAGAIALVPDNSVKILLVVPVALAALLCWTALRHHRWLIVFFVSLLLLPPLPGPLGDSGVHVAPLFAVLGLFVGLMWATEWRSGAHPLCISAAVFLAVLLESVAFAALYSGWQIAIGSLLRVALFAVGAYVLFFSLAGPVESGPGSSFRFARFLFWTAFASALFACVDFYYQLPALAGSGEQHVWLEEGVFRRAQGVFYDASTLGNLCTFFLVMVVVSLFRDQEQVPCSRRVMMLGGIVFSAALIFSYSRASVASLFVAICVLALVRARSLRRSILVFCTTVALAAAGVRFALPSFSASYWDRIAGSFRYFWYAPDNVLSGRLTHWKVLIDFLRDQPWHSLFGVGYKTLPYSDFIGTTVIADNTYLSLLVETGLVGLAAFIVLNIAILRTGWRAARSSAPQTAFFGEWIFCFWCGEIVQMLSGDLITYWRVLPVYFWVLGAAARPSDEIT